MLLFFLLLVPLLSQAATAWPADTTAQYIGTGWSQPSDVMWHSTRNSLFVVDDDNIMIEVTLGGTVVHSWTITGDNEGVTYNSDNPNYIYIGQERPLDSIIQFDLTSETLTGRTWDLTPWMISADSNKGLEALVFIPDGYHPYGTTRSGGLFYAGLQDDGNIYVFDVDVTGTAVDHLATITLAEGVTDISGLAFSAETELLYAVYDGNNILVEAHPDGTVVQTYALPETVDDQEGVAILPSYPSTTTTLILAHDEGTASGAVTAYDNYPVSFPAQPEEEVPEEDTEEDVPTDDTPLDDTTTEETTEETTENTTEQNNTAASISSIRGLKHGRINVSYTDHTSQRFRVFKNAKNALYRLKVRRRSNPQFLLVTNPKTGRQVVVNGFTGELKKVVRD